MRIGRHVSIDQRAESQQTTVLIGSIFFTECLAKKTIGTCQLPGLIITTMRVGEDETSLAVYIIISINRQEYIQRNTNQQTQSAGERKDIIKGSPRACPAKRDGKQ